MWRGTNLISKIIPDIYIKIQKVTDNKSSENVILERKSTLQEAKKDLTDIRTNLPK